jgi:transposase
METYQYIVLKLASGNQADSSCFGKIAVEYQKQLKVNSLIVADWALYTESNLKMMNDVRFKLVMSSAIRRKISTMMNISITRTRIC